MGRLDELWDGEYLPEIQRHLARLGGGRPGGPGPAAARRRRGRRRRTGEAAVRDPLPDLVPLHVRDQPVRRLLPRRPRQRQRLRRVPPAAGLRQHDGGERPCAVAAQSTGAARGVRPRGPGARTGRGRHRRAGSDGRRTSVPGRAAGVPRGVGPARGPLGLELPQLDRRSDTGDQDAPRLRAPAGPGSGRRAGGAGGRARTARRRRPGSACAASRRTCGSASSSCSGRPRRRSCSPRTTRTGSTSAACTTCIGSGSRSVGGSRPRPSSIDPTTCSS